MSTSPQQAFDQGEVPNARAVGMGGALNALGVSTASLFLNPANMALAKVYHLEAFAAYSPEAKRQTYGGAVVDSVINSAHIAGGLGGSWNEYDPSGIDRRWTDIRGGLAFPLGDYLALGATVRWLRADQGLGTGPFGTSYASDGNNGPLFNSITLDAGATVSLGDSFRIGLVGHNLTNPGTALAPVVGAVGVGYTTPTFSIEGDGSLDFTTFGSARGRLAAGGEYFAADHYALRLGWRRDWGTAINSGSIGLGYVDPKWSIEISVRRDFISHDAETLGIVSLRYFYDAVGSQPTPDQGGDMLR
ncbi:MAG TPA: hypothetical protein VHV30_03115 [Polyangiaceae bacterium]|nr:hypothetical protein [Polyangiaceae bacterium]